MRIAARALLVTATPAPAREPVPDSAEIRLPAGSDAVPLDAALWAPGSYIVRATAGGVNVSTRVVPR